jgi:hypothetical protein
VKTPFFVLFAFLCVPAAYGQKPAEASDAFFKSDKVLQLSLELGPKEMDALRREPRKYVKGTLKEGDKIVYKDVGVHLKGAAGSFRGIDDKPNVTINMDRFVKGQLFHGMDKFHLTNSLQDPSYLSELICGELFRAAGVPASRVAHAVVKIDGKPRGLFYIKEGYDTLFLKRHFGNNLGNFYDGGFLRDIDQASIELAELREMGVRCAIDDFGTGFSSLSYLSKLPIDTLKIDRAFVIDMTAGPEGLALVSTIITLAHSLKLKVVAEGVETEEQSRLLRFLSCDEMQGYLFSKPVPSETFENRFLALPAAADQQRS